MRFLASAERELRDLFEVQTLLAQRQAPEAIVAAVQAFGPRYLLLDLNLERAVSSRGVLRALAASKALRGCEVRLISFGRGTLKERSGSADDEGEVGETTTGEQEPAAGPMADSVADAAQLSDAGATETFDERVIESYQGISPRVRGPLIRKPISAFALQAELLGSGFYEAPAEWRNMPLPLRVLDRHFHQGRWLSRVVYANPAWRQANMYRPEPDSFRDWLELGRCPDQPQRYGGNPFDSDASAYRIHSFLLQQEGRDYLGQVVESVVQAPGKNSLDDSIRAIFSAMDSAGFSHGQCFLLKPVLREPSSVITYRSLDPPPSDGDVNAGEEAIGTVVRLHAVTDDHPQSLKDQLPVVKPLRGELRRRARAYYPEFAQEAPHAKRLIYKIRKAEDDKKTGDEDIAAWSRCLDQNAEGGHPTQSWLEIPVLALAKHPLGAGRAPARWPRIVAVLMFSRTAASGTDATSLRDADSEVSPEAVAPVKTLLLGLIEPLKRAIFDEHRRQYIAAQNRIAHYDRLLHESADMQRKKDLLVECFGKVTGADYTFLNVPDRDSQRVLVNSALWQHPDAPLLPDLVRSMRVPLDNETFAIVRTWRQQIAHYTQDGYRSGHNQSLDEEYKKILGDQAETWIAWTKAHIGTALVFPVLVNARSLGVMLLYFQKPWQLIDDLIPYIDSIAHRARWLLQAAADTEAERATWLLTIGHEMRRDLYTADNAVHRLEQEFQAPAVAAAALPRALPVWRRLRRSLVNAMSLAENWVDTMREIDVGDPGSTFTAIEVIDAYLDLNRELLQHDNHRVEIIWRVGRHDPAWHTPLAYRSLFERVLRVLLDNAWKFGHAHVSRFDDEAAVVVELRAARQPGLHPQQAGLLEIDIRNPGSMSAEAWRHRFDATPPPSERQRDGAHVGLHAARKLTRATGGEIELDNLTGPEQPTSEAQVVARLRWPLHEGER
ncbi:MAG: ATP-binding protein [Xanthomonadaceae bacterium]|nr:ATP-binding protein [Xanthomonadaceae bacterium]